MILADRLRIRIVGVLIVLVQIKTSSVTKAKTDKELNGSAVDIRKVMRDDVGYRDASVSRKKTNSYLTRDEKVNGVIL